MVGYLGMPVDAMSLYTDTTKYRRKADRIYHLILRTGKMGHNIDKTYRVKYPGMVVKAINFFRRLREFVSWTVFFPENAMGFVTRYVGRRVIVGMKKK